MSFQCKKAFNVLFPVQGPWRIRGPRPTILQWPTRDRGSITRATPPDRPYGRTSTCVAPTGLILVIYTTHEGMCYLKSRFWPVPPMLLFIKYPENSQTELRVKNEKSLNAKLWFYLWVFLSVWGFFLFFFKFISGVYNIIFLSVFIRIHLND